ncbi:MAG: S1 RNA-binding domain-containing protein [Anaerocolumna sp.]
MNTELDNILVEETAQVVGSAQESTSVGEVPSVEEVPTMKDYEDQINKSFTKMEEGTILKGTVIGISDTEVTVDLGSYAEGIIRLEDLSNDPRFSIKFDVTIGEEISAAVMREDARTGNILLSKKEADNILSWAVLNNYMEQRKVLKVKIAQEVNGGVTTYLEGIRAFIPASQLSLDYVNDLSSYVGKELNVIVITVDEANNKLVLSGKELEKDKKESEKKSKISRLQIGLVTKGVVEKIMPYGAFVVFGEGLSGLLHISQISNKRIKSPNEVIKEGEEVTVKITEVKDGKISLSMKAVAEESLVEESIDEVPFEFSTGGEASTGLGSLLSKIKL